MSTNELLQILVGKTIESIEYLDKLSDDENNRLVITFTDGSFIRINAFDRYGELANIFVGIIG